MQYFRSWKWIFYRLGSYYGSSPEQVDAEMCPKACCSVWSVECRRVQCGRSIWQWVSDIVWTWKLGDVVAQGSKHWQRKSRVLVGFLTTAEFLLLLLLLHMQCIITEACYMSLFVCFWWFLSRLKIILQMVDFLTAGQKRFSFFIDGHSMMY